MNTGIDLSTTSLLTPSRLQAGDRVRFVSPASPPDREAVLQRARVLESWGLKVDFGARAFDRVAYLAGTDEDRLSDLNEAFRDPEIRAVFTTRGGKGSYRIADRLDFGAVRADPKFLVGFSDITVLHLSLWKHCGLVGIHGALMDENGRISEENEAALRQALMTRDPTIIRSRPDNPTAALTTTGRATGPLIGGNLDMIATAAGWALPKLAGAILLIEDVGKYLGHVDRQLTMLRKAGHLDGLAGVAVGQFTGFQPSKGLTIVDLLREHLGELRVPLLGGLPLGHGVRPVSVPLGSLASLDTPTGLLKVAM